MVLNNNSYKISGNSMNAKISFCAEPFQACNATSAESAARKLYRKLSWPKMKLAGARDCTKTKFHKILEQGLTFLFCKIRLGREKNISLCLSLNQTSMNLGTIYHRKFACGKNPDPKMRKLLILCCWCNLANY